jgi:hypothetical protein
VRGARGLGEPEVEPGRSGLVLLGSGVSVAALPATITAVQAGRSWSWRVLGVEMAHEVAAEAAGGSRVTITLRAAWPLERALELSYAPIVALVLRRLARLAAEAQ